MSFQINLRTLINDQISNQNNQTMTTEETKKNQNRKAAN